MSLLASSQKITCCYSIPFYINLSRKGHTMLLVILQFPFFKTEKQVKVTEVMMTQFSRGGLRLLTLNLPFYCLADWDTYLHCKGNLFQIVHEKADKFLLLAWKNQAIWLPSWHIWIRISGWKFRSKQAKKKRVLKRIDVCF